MQQFSENQLLRLALTKVAYLKVGSSAWADSDAVIDAFRVLWPLSWGGDALEATVLFTRGDLARTRKIIESMNDWETKMPSLTMAYAGSLAATGSSDWVYWARKGIDLGGENKEFCEKLMAVMDQSAIVQEW